MTILHAFAIFYAAVFVFSISMTIREQVLTGVWRNPLMVILGYLACLFWPIVWVGMLVLTRLQDSRPARERPAP